MRATLLVLLAASLFATLGPSSRGVYAAGLSPFAFVTWRAALGAAAIWAWTWWRRGRHGAPLGWGALDRRAWSRLLIAVAVSALLNLAMFSAFARTAIPLVLLAFYTYPALIAGSHAVLGLERLSQGRIAALLLALVGMVAVVLGGLGSTSGIRTDLLGVGLALSAAVCQAVFMTVSRDGYRALPTDVSMGAILTGAAAMSAVAAVASGGLGTLAVPLGEPALLAALVLLGIFAGAVPSILLLAGIRRLGGVRSGILMLAEPVVGVALAAALLHEAILPIQVLGGAAILIGAALAQRGSPARSEQAGRVIEGAAPRLPEPTPPVAAAGLGLEDEVDAAVALHVPGGP